MHAGSVKLKLFAPFYSYTAKGKLNCLYFKKSFGVGYWWVICVQMHIRNFRVCPIPREVRNDSSVEKGLHCVQRKVSGVPSPLFVPESAKVCLIERYVLGAGGNCQILNCTFCKSLCPHLRLGELKEIRRKMSLSYLFVYTVAFDRFLDTISSPNRVKFLWLLVQVLSCSSERRKAFSNTSKVIEQTEALTEAINILHSLKNTCSTESTDCSVVIPVFDTQKLLVYLEVFLICILFLLQMYCEKLSPSELWK